MCLARILENHEDQPIPGPIKAWKIVLRGKKALSCFKNNSITITWQTDTPGDRIASWEWDEKGLTVVLEIRAGTGGDEATLFVGGWKTYKTGFHTYFTKEAAQEALNSWNKNSDDAYGTCKNIPVEIMDITTIGTDGSVSDSCDLKNYVSQKIRLYPIKMKAKPKTKRK
jgi:hypothetical protein